MRGATRNGEHLLRRAVVDLHAVDEVPRVRHQPADVDRRENLTSQRVERTTALRRRDRREQRRRLRTAPVAGHKRRDLVTVTLRRRHVVEADAGIQGEVRFHPPVVLRVPLGDQELAVRRGMPVGLGVLGDGAKQPIGKADVGVAWVLRVGVEAVVPVEARRPRRRPRRVLDEETRLQRVGALQLRDVARSVEQRVVAKKRKPLLDVERARWFREGRR